jgi:hypothetical protein
MPKTQGSNELNNCFLNVKKVEIRKAATTAAPYSPTDRRSHHKQQQEYELPK